MEIPLMANAWSPTFTKETIFVLLVPPTVICPKSVNAGNTFAAGPDTLWIVVPEIASPWGPAGVAEPVENGAPEISVRFPVCVST